MVKSELNCSRIVLIVHNSHLTRQYVLVKSGKNEMPHCFQSFFNKSKKKKDEVKSNTIFSLKPTPSMFFVSAYKIKHKTN